MQPLKAFAALVIFAVFLVVLACVSLKRFLLRQNQPYNIPEDAL